VYRHTPRGRRKPLRHYYKRAFRGGSKSLIEDILFHDPLYVLLMFFGLMIYPSTPAWVLSLVSFVIAVFAVSGIEVGINELRFWWFKKRLLKRGFRLEPYYESHFFISSKESQREVVKSVAKEFGLHYHKPVSYQDIYFEHKVPEFSGRTARLRLRRRTHDKKACWFQTVQIIFTRAGELPTDLLEQHRYFPMKKSKLFFVLDEFPESIEEITHSQVRKLLLKLKCASPAKKVHFDRFIAHNDELLVGADAVKGDYFVVELKVFSNKSLLKEAMRCG